MRNDWELLFLENRLWVLSTRTHIPIYDFNFRAYFPSRTPWQRNEEVSVVARIGAFDDYEAAFSSLLSEGIRLIHSPDEHFRSSQLPGWYPLIEDLTPKSRWFTEVPNAEQIEKSFGWPVFVKGIRQTSRHKRSLSIINDPEHYRAAIETYQNDSILRWQPIVVREFVPLQRVEDTDQTRIPSSFEFRTFWWRGKFAGAGRYWWEGRTYEWDVSERQDGLALAEEVAKRMTVPFLVVDLAMTATGRWLVIECNDGQESGYAGVSPIGLWQTILKIEEERQVDDEEDCG